ncbi:hypothetical protein [Pandoravirus japonicus]|uniref:Uncharacterized protein n=1 Tax=Pandoravirus japonicus TaxID=2823154 RepID=A0A811BPY8_9VIRU|nr:hypothetical protein [Pandoravirus japonicus]
MVGYCCRGRCRWGTNKKVRRPIFYLFFFPFLFFFRGETRSTGLGTLPPVLSGACLFSVRAPSARMGPVAVETDAAQKKGGAGAAQRHTESGLPAARPRNKNRKKACLHWPLARVCGATKRRTMRA